MGKQLIKSSSLLCTAVIAALGLFGSHNLSANAEAQSTSETKKEASGASNEPVKAWFAKYDQIRRDAEMTMNEKLQARSVLTKGLDPASSEEHKEKSKKFAETMSARFGKAAEQLKQLPSDAATEKLQDGYTHFFGQLETIYSEVANGDKATGKPVGRAELKQKKDRLTAEDKQIKELDRELREKYSIAAHKHK